MTSLVLNMPSTEYHASDAISSSDLGALHRSPLHFRANRARNEEKTPTGPMLFGTATHLAVLCGEDAFMEGTSVTPPYPKTTKEGKIAWDEFKQALQGRVPITLDQRDAILTMRDAITDHPTASVALSGGTAESSLFWDETVDVDGTPVVIPCRARPDYLSRVIEGKLPDDLRYFLVDYKTCSDAGPLDFGRSVVRYRYHVQMAWYRRGLVAHFKRPPTACLIVAQESEAPHAVAVYAMDADALRAGARAATEDLFLYAKALTTNTWTGYGDGILPLALPKGALV